jgi:hypothetical protein
MIHFDSQDKILANIARIVEKRLKDKNTELTLVLDESMGEFNSKFEDGVITAGSHADILYVAGKYLRHPDMENGEFHSFKPICGLYWATHNRGYAECAPMEELYEDLEEQALWGMNIFKVWFDMAQHKIEESADFIERLKNLLRFVKSLGIKTVMGGPANEAFTDSPEELRADWTPGHDGYVRQLNAHYHREICPSKPGGIEKIIEYRQKVLKAFSDVDIDFVPLSPYDQGGCTCSACAPWGGNGYLKCVKALIPAIKEVRPNAKFYINTWYFGSFREKGDVSEFDLLREEIAKGTLDDVTYITCEPQTHPYPFEKPLGKPYIGFPEISMCGIWPWGGYGAIAVPMKMQKLWDNNKDKLEGGFPYCEGYYEDINKAIMLRLYRDDQPATETVREYLAYEFGFEGEMLDKVHAAVMAMEETHARGWDPGHRYPITHPEKIFDIEKAILEAHESLSEEMKNNRKWRLFYYRAVIDAELARNDFYRNDKVMEYFKEMITLYHLENGGWHIKPDIQTDEKYGRPLTKEELKTIALGGTID